MLKPQKAADYHSPASGFRASQEEEGEDAKPSTTQLAASLNGAGPKPLKAGIGKNPHVTTDFLPDRDRDMAEERLRQQLRMEYELRQQVTAL